MKSKTASCEHFFRILVLDSCKRLKKRSRACRPRPPPPSPCLPRFVLSGANIMCPGLTHPNAVMTPAPKDTVVAVMAEGKEHALAIGCTAMSTDEIKSKNKGVGVDNYHYLNDGLWNMKEVKC